MKKLAILFVALLILLTFGLMNVKTVKALEAPNWDISGDWMLDFAGGSNNREFRNLSQDEEGNVTGEFLWLTGGEWKSGGTLEGDVSGDKIYLFYDRDPIDYTGEFNGIITENGMSGTFESFTTGFEAEWSITGNPVFIRQAGIEKPEEESVVIKNLDLEAYLIDDDKDHISWAVRKGTCSAGTNTVLGNVDGHSNSLTMEYDAENYSYKYTGEFDVSGFDAGMYCFVFNPSEDSGESGIRLTRKFYLLKDTKAPIVTIDDPSEEDCLSDTVKINGTVQDDYELSHYNIAVYPGDANYMDFSERLEQKTVYLTEGFENEEIFEWDTTGYDDGEYSIRLAARDAAGNRDLSGDPYLGGDDSQHVIKVIVANNKAGILYCSGVPGKGISKAPGLQKPFNPKSKAKENAGKRE